MRLLQSVVSKPGAPHEVETSRISLRNRPVTDTTKADQLRALREGRFKTFDKSVRAVKELREKIAVVGKKRKAKKK